LKAEIIIIGNEILTGDVIDKNSPFLSRELLRLGITVTRIITIPDNKNEILETLQNAIARSKLVILTGGLGPTYDDITKKTVSVYFNKRLILNENILRKVKNFFKTRKITMPAVNTTQALIPQGALILDNPIGTAPGLLFEEKGKIIVLLPGVPEEVKEIFNDSLKRYLRKTKLKKIIATRIFHTTGISESALYEKLKNIPEIEKLGFLPSTRGVDIKIKIIADTAEEVQNKFKEITNRLIMKVGNFYYGSDDETLERVIGILLSMKRQTLAVAESCTAGLIMKRITEVPGSSHYFLGGAVSYSNESKIKILKVKTKEIKQKGAVSAEVAKEMAEGVRNLLKADYGISVTGIAGPTGSTLEKPIGLVYIGIADSTGTETKEFHFHGTREDIRERSAQAALDLLRRKLLGMETDYLLL